MWEAIQQDVVEFPIGRSEGTLPGWLAHCMISTVTSGRTPEQVVP